jgi:colanic acid/amylovoran biosynthesis glycosyltransferase
MSISTQERDTPRVAYIVSRFPKISETFILSEIVELEKLGLPVTLFSLLREQEETLHPQAAAMLDRVQFARLASREVMASQWFWLMRKPAPYVRAWWRAIWGNRQSLGFLLRALMIVPIAAHFAREALRLGIDRVHGAWATHPALAAYVIHLLTGIPYSFTVHSHELYIDRTMLDEKIAHADFFTTISDYNRRMIASLYGHDAERKMRVIHCGVRPDVFRPITRSGSRGPFTILCVASLERHKGHIFLLEACAELRRRGVAFRCQLVGDGEDRPMLEQLAANLGVAGEIEFLGPQPSPRVVELLQQADVVTLQSVMLPNGMSEGIPVALMEALATERPVVASDLRGIPELVEHERSGLLVPPGDPEALAAALLRIHDDPELARRMGRAGRQTIVREFDLRLSAAELFEIFAGQGAVFVRRLSA